MTGEPLAGPASAYPTLRRPASICFSDPNVRSCVDLVADCAFAEARLPNWAAARVMAATLKKLRRRSSIFSDLVFMSTSPRFTRRRLRGNAAHTACARAALFISYRLAQRPERFPHLGGEEHRLLPGREVGALIELVVVDEIGIRSL